MMLKSLKGSIQHKCAKHRGKKYKESSKALLEEGYYSQCGQDKFVNAVLYPGKTDGVFVDIGANDGVTLSNTYCLEKLGWKGLAVEPIPSVFEKLKSSRNCSTLRGCVGEKPGKAKFRSISGYSEMLSGIVNEYDVSHEERIHREIKEKGGYYEDIEIDRFQLGDLLQEHGLTTIHYLSIDVEGAELSILKGIDFDKVRIETIGVENSHSNHDIQNFLTNRGFKFHCIIGDEFYLLR
jgi:FkbM family methyltransferase